MRRATMIMLIAALAVMILGIVLGEVRQVFANATLLCLSCIGIG